MEMQPAMAGLGTPCHAARPGSALWYGARDATTLVKFGGQEWYLRRDTPPQPTRRSGKELTSRFGVVPPEKFENSYYNLCIFQQRGRQCDSRDEGSNTLLVPVSHILVGTGHHLVSMVVAPMPCGRDAVCYRL